MYRAEIRTYRDKDRFDRDTGLYVAMVFIDGNYMRRYGKTAVEATVKLQGDIDMYNNGKIIYQQAEEKRQLQRI